MFEPKYLMKALSDDMILSEFIEYNYYHEARSKPELILFWVRDSVAVYKKSTQILMDYSDININKMNNTDIVVGGDNGQGVFRFSMKILCIINTGKSRESLQYVGYIVCKQDHGIIL